jgi:hypothetical protein
MRNTFLTANWQNLIMANYEVNPKLLEPYLPKGVQLDYFQGKTYVSLVGFLFKNTKIFNIPIPLLGTFEEVNLRFYVVKKEGNTMRRGVVFIDETVPNQLVAWVANKLYKEHYRSIPTKYNWNISTEQKEITYQWKIKSVWNHLQVNASALKEKIKIGSIEEYIFEHYYGYTKVNDVYSIEYKINHPSWEIHTVKHYQIQCNFAATYGQQFACLNNVQPSSIMLAEGSAISVDWKRTKF